MGLFDFFENIGKKVVSGVKSLGNKIETGVSSLGNKISKTLNLKKNLEKAKDVFNEMGKAETWERGTKQAGEWLQAPQKWIQEHDPLAKKMGDFGALSPLSLVPSLFTAPFSGAGYLLGFADKKQRDKIESGDPETIANTAMSALSVIPMPGGGAAGSAVRGTAKGGRALGKAVMKSSLGML